ncbi:hypothetical protein ACLOJK_012469 [Asimina triloba]
MKWGMELLSSPSYPRNSGWFVGGSKSSKWTHYENKQFENALAVYDKDTPDRWQNVASMIPDKSIQDVISHYKELEADICDIEAGRIAIPGYGSSSFTLEWGNDRGFDSLKPAYALGGKRGVGRADQQERKKGVPWTEDEHRIEEKLIMKRHILNTYSEKFIWPAHFGASAASQHVILDRLSEMQFVNRLQESGTGSMQNTSDQFSMSFVSSQPNDEASFFNPSVHQTHGNPIMPPYGMPSYGMKIQAQNYQRGSLNESVGSQNPDVGFHWIKSKSSMFSTCRGFDIFKDIVEFLEEGYAMASKDIQSYILIALLESATQWLWNIGRGKIIQKSKLEHTLVSENA